MIFIAAAGNAEDFSAAAALCRALGKWDAREAPKHGVPPELVTEL